MKTLIVYDSFFGNTEKVAQAIAEALGGPADVKVLRAGEARPEHLQGVGFLVVGSPTRGFRPTKAVTLFLKGLPEGALKGIRVAAFDTRIPVAEVNSRFLHFMVRLFGYAAEPLAALLLRKGGVPALPPVGFIVGDSEGPLREGELARAAGWVSGVRGV